ncbi:MAG: uroporphyrinogen decarboxylase family protein [Pirellulales bacterium]|nr:uroporphyrinogen decarboxylase family protein [Pirellulales bacterium]
MNPHERVTAMLEGRSTGRVPNMPITMMFAADQLGVPYGEYATNCEKLVEAQLLTAQRFGFDHVSVISDPACEASDCGAKIQFFDDQPPAIDETAPLLADKTTLASLEVPDPDQGRMLNRVKGVELFRQKVGSELFIEGWIEGPCAEAADLRGINHLMIDFFDDPAFVRDLFEFNIEMATRFAQAQVDAGVDIVGLGDAAASLVGPQIYEEFVLPYERRLIEKLHGMGTRVRLHICGNITAILPHIGTLGVDMLDVDSMVSLADAREAVSHDVTLAGNINPVEDLRNSTPEKIVADIKTCRAQSAPRYIAAAGCEIPRDTPDENVRAILTACEQED